MTFARPSWPSARCRTGSGTKAALTADERGRSESSPRLARGTTPRTVSRSARDGSSRRPKSELAGMSAADCRRTRIASPGAEPSSSASASLTSASRPGPSAGLSRPWKAQKRSSTP